MLLPVTASCVLVAGLSPRLPLNPAYSGFLSRLATRLRLVAKAAAVS